MGGVGVTVVSGREGGVVKRGGEWEREVGVGGCWLFARPWLFECVGILAQMGTWAAYVYSGPG